MASKCCQQKERSFPFAPLSDSGIQPSRLPAGERVCFSKNGEILNSDDSDDDDDDLPFVSEILARSRRVQPQAGPPAAVIDLTRESDSDDGEVSWHRKAPRRHPIELSYFVKQGISSSSTQVLRPLPTSSHELTQITHESSSSCPAAALPGGKKSPFKNRPPWSPYLHKPHGSPIEPPSEPSSYACVKCSSPR
jgi:hypothetical protein